MLTRPRLRSGNASMIKTTGSFLGTVIMRPTGRTVLGAISSARHSMGRQKTQSTTDSGSLNTFGRNEIEVVPISSALLRIACLVILNKTGRVSDQELAADRVSSSNFTVCLFAFENRSSATLDQLGIETPQRVELDVGQRPDPNCLAGHVGLEHRNVVANYPFERSHRFRESSRIPAAETVRV